MFKLKRTASLMAVSLFCMVSSVHAAELTADQKTARIPVAAKAPTPQAASKPDVSRQQVAAKAPTPQAASKPDVSRQQVAAKAPTPQAASKPDVSSQRAAAKASTQEKTPGNRFSRIPANAKASTPQAASKLDVSRLRADTHVSALEKHPGNRFSRIPSIMVRGAFDAISTPFELIRTPIAESKEHPRLWPVTSVTRTGANVFYRLTSAVYDIAFYPFAAPFVNETPPLTEKMGLAADIWELEDEY